MTLDNIKEEILNSRNIVILTHEVPDGDAIGSSLAMYLALKQIGKEVDVLSSKVPKVYNFLPSIDVIKQDGNIDNYDLAIALDCGDIRRLNGFSNYFEDANCRISIDHHEANTMFADYNFVNPTAPACSQILITVLKELGIEITKEIGTCLLTGIITDTGGFKYQNVTAETFEFAAELLSKGVNVSDIFRRVMQSIPKEKFELKKIATDRIELLENGKIAFTYITRKDEEQTKCDDHDGIVEIGRDIEGVEVSIFLRELDKNNYKISLRSNDYVNVSDICLMFNGGGHIRAAGGSINGLPLEKAKEKLVLECKKNLKKKIRGRLYLPL